MRAHWVGGLLGLVVGAAGGWALARLAPPAGGAVGGSVMAAADPGPDAVRAADPAAARGPAGPGASAACPAAAPAPIPSPPPACPPALAAAAGPAPAASRGAGAVALPPAAPAVPEPFPLSKEHAQILQAPDERPTLPQLHRQLLDEPRDADWAAATEELLRRDLAAANQAGDFDIPTIQCRQTLCEVLAFGNSPAAIQRWQAAMQERSGAWREAAGLVGNSLSITSAGGRAVIVGILERRPPRRP